MAWNAVFTASVSGIEDKHVSKLKKKKKFISKVNLCQTQ
jgi:hypothetical protein